jgi:hypothetical protein
MLTLKGGVSEALVDDTGMTLRAALGSYHHGLLDLTFRALAV